MRLFRSAIRDEHRKYVAFCATIDDEVPSLVDICIGRWYTDFYYEAQDAASTIQKVFTTRAVRYSVLCCADHNGNGYVVSPVDETCLLSNSRKLYTGWHEYVIKRFSSPLATVSSKCDGKEEAVAGCRARLTPVQPLGRAVSKWALPSIMATSGADG
jgi:hypothetical protein